MRLLRLSETDTSGATVFKEPTAQPVALVGGMALIALAIIYGGAQSDQAFMSVLGGGLLLMATWMGWVVRTAFLPTNWVLAIDARRVLVHFRPYVNTTFPTDDPQVLEIAHGEIAGARRTEVTVTERIRNNVVSRPRVYLTLRLKDADLGEFRERLRYELTFRSRGVTLCHHPVGTRGRDEIRVGWAGTSAWLRPKIDQALWLLTPHVAVDPDERMAVDLTHPQTVDPRARDWYLNALLQQGEPNEALACAMRLYGVGMNEARQRLAELEAREPSLAAAPGPGESLA